MTLMSVCSNKYTVVLHVSSILLFGLIFLVGAMVGVVAGRHVFCLCNPGLILDLLSLGYE